MEQIIPTILERAISYKERSKSRDITAQTLLTKIVTLSDLLRSDHLDDVSRNVVGRKMDELILKL